MSICLRCGKEFENDIDLTCQKCNDRIFKIIKENVERNQRELEIQDRWEIMDL